MGNTTGLRRHRFYRAYKKNLPLILTLAHSHGLKISTVLARDWGQSTYVNPPFSGPTAWVRKAIAESEKGKQVVFVFPLPKWALLLLTHPNLKKVRNLKDIKWCAIEDGSSGRGIGQHIALFKLDGRHSAETARIREELAHRFCETVPPGKDHHMLAVYFGFDAAIWLRDEEVKRLREALTWIEQFCTGAEERCGHNQVVGRVALEARRALVLKDESR